MSNQGGCCIEAPSEVSLRSKGNLVRGYCAGVSGKQPLRIRRMKASEWYIAGAAALYAWQADMAGSRQ